MEAAFAKQMRDAKRTDEQMSACANFATITCGEQVITTSVLNDKDFMASAMFKESISA